MLSWMTLKTICKLAQFMLTVIAVHLPDLGRGEKAGCTVQVITTEEKLLGYLVWYTLYSLTGLVPAVQLPVQNRHWLIGSCTQKKKNKLLWTYIVFIIR